METLWVAVKNTSHLSQKIRKYFACSSFVELGKKHELREGKKIKNVFISSKETRLFFPFFHFPFFFFKAETTLRDEYIKSKL
jgi:hypothetical protein